MTASSSLCTRGASPTTRRGNATRRRPGTAARLALAAIVVCLPFSLLTSLAATAGAADAEEASTGRAAYGVGDRIEPFRLEDQHGEMRSVDDATRIVLFSRDMDGGDLLKEALADVPDGFLEERDAVYVSDISGMPGLVARLFALPSMRRRGYPMLLDREGDQTARLPDREGRATLLFLEGGRIERTLFAESSEEILRALEP